MNYKKTLTGSENLYLNGVPELSIQVCDDGLWLHFTTLDGKLHSSINLPVKFAKGTYLYDSIICKWSEEYRKAISKMSPALIGEAQPEEESDRRTHNNAVQAAVQPRKLT